MVKRAKTEHEKERVNKYLKDKNLPPLTNDLFYCENDKNEIIGAMGIEIKVCIEPLQSESPVTSKELLDYGLGMLTGLGYQKAHVLTSTEKVREQLSKHYTAIQWGENLKELIIKL